MWKRAALAVSVAAAAVAAWGILVERNRFTLREHTLPILPAGHKPIRVLQLSDLHMAPWQRGKQEWIASLARLRPDLVVGTGDFLGHARGLSGVARAIEPFRGIPGVFVNGSNDYFAPHFKNPLKYFLGPSKSPARPQRIDTAGLLRLYADLGWLDLNNAAAALNIKGTQIGFFGVDDAHKGYDDIDAATTALPGLGAIDLAVGVTHAPYRRVLDAFTATGAALVCAGHTHGGQVCLPESLGGTLVTNCDLPRAQARGMSIWHVGTDAAALNVSAGIGTSITAPIRLFCPPEASLLTLIASD